jgi:hypothetical protein
MFALIPRRKKRLPSSSQEACEKMESGEHAREAEEYLSLWFHEWTALGLFSEEY